MMKGQRMRLLIGGALILLLADIMQLNDKLTRDVRHRSVVGPDLGQAALGSLNGHEQARALQSRAVAQQNPLTRSAVASSQAVTEAWRDLPEEKRSKVIETGEYVLYLPSELDLQSRHPLLVALSPTADAWGMIRAWQPVVEKHKWLLYASKTSRNGVPYAGVVPPLIAAVKSVGADYPVDKSKIVATGLSGGGMASHYLAYRHPELFAAVIINTGMMAEEQPAWPNPPRGKIAVFVASPTDFRYQQMKKDRLFLESLDWKTHWIEFPGGHTLAPSAILEEAAQWLSQELQKNGHRS